MESAAMGIAAGLFTVCEILGKQVPRWDNRTAIGALLDYISHYAGKDFQPMNINFGLMAPLQTPIRNKAQRHEAISIRAEQAFWEQMQQDIMD